MLAHAILLSPLGDGPAVEDFRRDLLPHAEHVRNCQDENRVKFEKNQKMSNPKLSKWLPNLQPMSTPRDIIRLAKYSRV